MMIEKQKFDRVAVTILNHIQAKIDLRMKKHGNVNSGRQTTAIQAKVNAHQNVGVRNQSECLN
jgi:hypothetical protein